MALFQFNGVTLTRGAARVLDELTVTIPDTGITAVIGASGSGKSTLLRCCNLLESPTQGQILFRGNDLATVDPLAHRRQVAMVFQTPTLFPGTAHDNLLAADPFLDAPDAVGLLERVGLPAGVLEREADTLSGGEAQRLCLARALGTRPDAILADESTSALDEGSTAVLEHLAQDLAADGIPIVWVTHDLDQMRRLGDFVIELGDGRTTFTGTVDEHARRDEGAR